MSWFPSGLEFRLEQKLLQQPLARAETEAYLPDSLSPTSLGDAFCGAGVLGLFCGGTVADWVQNMWPLRFFFAMLQLGEKVFPPQVQNCLCVFRHHINDHLQML